MDGTVPDKILAPLAGKPVFAHSAATFFRSGVIDTFVVTYRDQHQMAGTLRLRAHPLALRPRRRRAAGFGRRRPRRAARRRRLRFHPRLRPPARPRRATGRPPQNRPPRGRRRARPPRDRHHQGAPRRRPAPHARPRATLGDGNPAGLLPRSHRPRLRPRRGQKLRITDDAAAVELLKHPVALLENPYPNPKLTTPADLAYLEFLLTQTGSKAPFASI